MVLGVIIAVVTAPGLLGSQEAIRQSQSKEKREEHRARRCNLIATCVKSSMRSREINGRPVVLKNGKVHRHVSVPVLEFVTDVIYSCGSIQGPVTGLHMDTLMLGTISRIRMSSMKVLSPPLLMKLPS
jgi:hypothetical protein